MDETKRAQIDQLIAEGKDDEAFSMAIESYNGYTERADEFLITHNWLHPNNIKYQFQDLISVASANIQDVHTLDKYKTSSILLLIAVGMMEGYQRRSLELMEEQTDKQVDE